MAEALALDTGWDEDQLVATREDGTPISPERWCDGHSSDITAVYPPPPHDCEAARRMTAYPDPSPTALHGPTTRQRQNPSDAVGRVLSWSGAKGTRTPDPHTASVKSGVLGCPPRRSASHLPAGLRPHVSTASHRVSRCLRQSVGNGSSGRTKVLQIGLRTSLTRRGRA